MVAAAEQHVVPPLVALDGAVAERVAECHQDLVVGGITVVPKYPKVGSRNTEAFESLIRAVRPGHPIDERCVRAAECANRIRRACRRRCLWYRVWWWDGGPFGIQLSGRGLGAGGGRRWSRRIGISTRDERLLLQRCRVGLTRLNRALQRSHPGPRRAAIRTARPLIQRAENLAAGVRHHGVR